ncbi:DUF1499 domain-containing protein [Evansella sp. AB-rgal1]|uniref:DUF1499 domain-containing protein n=1 Tax=Evansella sp. AB-rgal1 TaxID=3242696 RepID=UPI00359EE717
MSFMYTLKKIFSKHTETKEKHIEEKLRTRYYKATKDQVMKDLDVMFRNKKGYEIKSISDTHGEIVLKYNDRKKGLIVITVIMVKPFKTAVDFSVDTDTALFTDFGASRKLIYQLYKEVDKKLHFIGTGLGDELTKY